MTKFGLQELHLCEAIIREALKKQADKVADMVVDIMEVDKLVNKVAYM